jgi:AraC family transcriptional regulator of adaptative response / DNA-3-methyladenine glycosylase II
VSQPEQVVDAAPCREEPVDEERWWRAVQGQDTRFDGRFVVGVLTTGIYCRPSCPARTPLRTSVRFLPSAAAAQAAGLHACKRCVPDASPGRPVSADRSDVAGRALTLIADVAFAAGFGSVRQCSATFREVYATTPRELRARRGGTGAPVGADGRTSLELRLPFRPPLWADSLFGHLAATAVPGVEEWRDGAYRRTLRLPHGTGVVALRPGPTAIGCRLLLEDLRDLAPAVARCRRLLDLDADPVAADAVLADDDALARGSPRHPAGGSPAPSTPASWRCARSSASRSAPRRPAPTPHGSSPSPANPSTTPRAA